MSMTCYVDPNRSQRIMNEEIVFTQSAVCIKDPSTETKVDHLELQITTHKVRLHHAVNKAFNFEFHYDKIGGHKSEARGFFSKMVYKLTLTYQGKNYDIKLMDRGNFERPVKEFEQAYKQKSKWEVKRFETTQTGNNILSRLR